MKRFTIKKIRQQRLTSQGYLVKYSGDAYVIFDRQWKANLEAAGNFVPSNWEIDQYKYIDKAFSKAAAQLYINYLNNKYTEINGNVPVISVEIFNKGLKLNENALSKVILNNK